MKEEKTFAQMRKGVLEMCILKIISGGEVYTSDILKLLRESGLVVVEGTVYPLLTRLKNDDNLSYRWEESTSGPPRKYYSITPKGEMVLSEQSMAWDGLSESVNKIMHNKEYNND